MVTSKNILAQEFRKDRWAFLSVCEKTDAADVFWNKPFQTVSLNSACYLDIGTWVNFMALVAVIHRWGLPSHISRPRYVWNKKEKKKPLEETLSLKVIAYFPLLTVQLRLACNFHCNNLFIFLLCVKSLSFFYESSWQHFRLKSEVKTIANQKHLYLLNQEMIKSQWRDKNRNPMLEKFPHKKNREEAL